MVVKAKESEEIKNARRKLKQRLAVEKQQLTSKALKDMSKSIHQWLSRHAKERVGLKEKIIALFDENKHSAKTNNKFVQQLQQNLKEELSRKKAIKKLQGRVKLL